MLQGDIPRRRCDAFVLQSPGPALGKGTLAFPLLGSVSDIIKILDRKRSARRFKQTGPTSQDVVLHTPSSYLYKLMNNSIDVATNLT